MVESVKDNKKKRAVKKSLKSVIVGRVDTSVEDVVKYVQEGRELYFADGKDKFLSLPDKVVEDMTLTNRERYNLAKQITLGRDVVGTMEDGLRGWVKDYNVRPGSFSDNTQVFGKDKKYDYYLSSKERISSRLAQEWEIDRDPNVHMLQPSSSTLKTVGGENKPELILMRRKKETSAKYKQAKIEKQKKLIRSTKEKFVEGADKLGVEASIIE